MSDNGRVLKKNLTYLVSCPDCKKQRTISRVHYMENMRRKNNNRCGDCKYYKKGETNSGSFKKGTIPWNKGIFKKDADYFQIHKWIRRNYGNADHCQNINCENDSIFFDWAKLPNAQYDHNIENYIQLCRKCHRLMDVKKEKIEYARI